MSDDFKATIYTRSEQDDSEQEVTKLISAAEVESPEIQTWDLHDLSKEKDPQQIQREQAIYSEIEKKLQPEINRQTEILKKEAYDAAQKEGFDAGYTEGKALGVQEAKEIALAESETELTKQVDRLESILHSFDAPYQLLEQQVFDHLSALALHIAEEVIQQTISEKPEWILKIIHESVEALGDDLSPLEITLNPKDVELIQSVKESFAEHWRVNGSDRVEIGSCQVKQRNSSVEHDWKNRFESMSVKLQAQAVAEKSDS